MKKKWMNEWITRRKWTTTKRKTWEEAEAENNMVDYVEVECWMKWMMEEWTITKKQGEKEGAGKWGGKKKREKKKGRIWRNCG